MESLSEAEKRRKRNKKGKRKKIALWCNASYGAKHHMQIQHHPALRLVHSARALRVSEKLIIKYHCSIPSNPSLSATYYL